MQLEQQDAWQKCSETYDSLHIDQMFCQDSQTERNLLTWLTPQMVMGRVWTALCPTAMERWEIMQLGMDNLV